MIEHMLRRCYTSPLQRQKQEMPTQFFVLNYISAIPFRMDEPRDRASRTWYNPAARFGEPLHTSLQYLLIIRALIEASCGLNCLTKNESGFLQQIVGSSIMVFQLPILQVFWSQIPSSAIQDVVHPNLDIYSGREHNGYWMQWFP